MADVGIHQMTCDSARGLQLDDYRQRLGDARQSGDFVIGESAVAIGKPGYRVDLSARAGHRHRSIVSAAFVLELAQNCIVHRTVGLLQAPPDRAARALDYGNRAVRVFCVVLEGMSRREPDGSGSIAPPDVGRSVNLRMERAD